MQTGTGMGARYCCWQRRHSRTRSTGSTTSGRIRRNEPEPQRGQTVQRGNFAKGSS